MGGDNDAGSDAEVEGGEGGPKRIKRKLALVFGFVGHAYRGLQINYEVEKTAAKKSVEGVICEAMVRAKVLAASNAGALELKASWSRSSRTDAGVSAQRLVIAAKVLVADGSIDEESGHCKSVVDELNVELPKDIRCFSAVKVPKSFDAKKACSWREYVYHLPTTMAARKPKDGEEPEKPEAVAERLQRIMQRFEGCHSFHNFTRLKAAAVAPKQGQKGGKGKGGGKGKKGRGQKRKADEMEAEEGQEDGGACSDAEDDAAEKGQGEGVADDNATKPMTPCWVEICGRSWDSESKEWRERSADIIRHAQGSIYLASVETTRGGALLRVTLRGQFFLYNQIRLMVGTAVAVCCGDLADEMLEMALRLRVEMHMPLAPPTGLLLVTAGFTQMDNRTGFCAMDAEQAELCMLPNPGIVLMSKEGATAASAFTHQVEEAVEERWRETAGAEEWRQKLALTRAPEGDRLEELRTKLKEAIAVDLQERERKNEADNRRRDGALKHGGEHEFVGRMPRHFAADLMVRFRLIPGWRLQYIQAALAKRMRSWQKDAASRPPGISSPPQAKELLDYVASIGLDVLAKEGRVD
eukprot:TRINITY_DN36195_c0_g1_i1.p1 TRINITY_DN36195_c0_g1~~TRINITY_DN36195_c0_g1_i1.p1  ORF type:complete len:582 (-),score=143.74 TRINITY_DN36195_c0_g1_i1:142-1887(-)